MEEKLKQEIIELMKEYRSQDSIGIGNSKTGSIKIYADFSKKKETETKIQNAIDILIDKRGQILD